MNNTERNMKLDEKKEEILQKLYFQTYFMEDP